MLIPLTFELQQNRRQNPTSVGDNLLRIIRICFKGSCYVCTKLQPPTPPPLHFYIYIFFIKDASMQITDRYLFLLFLFLRQFSPLWHNPHHTTEKGNTAWASSRCSRDALCKVCFLFCRWRLPSVLVLRPLDQETIFDLQFQIWKSHLSDRPVSVTVFWVFLETWQ